MTGEQVPVRKLNDGDIVRLHHQHDPRLGACLCHQGDCDVQVVGTPHRAGERIAVDWCACRQLLGSCEHVTGVSVLNADCRVLRLGHAA